LDQAEIEEAVKELETRVDRLRSLYEQYFMGIEKLEPGVPKKDVERRFQLLRKEQIRNTALRFRFHMVLQRYNTYQSYWLRICRQIEEGTYKRDVLRAKARLGDEAQKKKQRRPGESEAPSFAVDLDGDMDLEDEVAIAPPPLPGRAPPLPKPAAAAAPAAAATAAAAPTTTAAAAAPAPRGFGTPPKPTQSKMKMLAIRLKGGAPAAAPAPAAASPPAAAAAPPPAPQPTPPIQPKPALPAAAVTPQAPAPRPLAAASPPAPAAKAPNDLSDERVRQLYSQYVDTKRKQNESTAAITYDNLAKTLRESSAKLKEKHAGKNVDFEVTIKDGKTILKPIVKETK
jgi:hypothetical protein